MSARVSRGHRAPQRGLGLTPEARLELARVLADQDKHEEAISCFEAAIAMMTISSRESACHSPDTQVCTHVHTRTRLHAHAYARRTRWHWYMRVVVFAFMLVCVVRTVRSGAECITCAGIIASTRRSYYYKLTTRTFHTCSLCCAACTHAPAYTRGHKNACVKG